MPRISPVEKLDFAEVKTSLKDYLRSQDQFKDYDFEGSNLSVIIDLLAYNAFYSSFYYNMAISENFLDSAQQRNSVISHAKELNYLPRSRRSSRAIMNVTITSTQSGNSITLPEGTKFAGRCGNRTFTFLTDKAYTGTRISGTNRFLVESVNALEGRLITEVIRTDDPVLSNKFIDTQSIKVTIDGEIYVVKSDIFGVGASDKVFYLQPEPDERYSIQFGEDVFGVQPTRQKDIVVEYRVCSGEQANGVKSLNLVSNLSSDVSTVTATLVTETSGGAFVETTESIKKFAPKALQIQERAVTKNDYEVLLKQAFNNIQAVSVFGGDEVDPPQYGKVIIAVDVVGGDGASTFELDSFARYLADKTPLAIEPVFVSAGFLYVDLDVNVQYDTNLTNKSASQIRSEVIAKILDYQNTNLNDFNVTLRQSNLSAVIDESDEAILSTDILAKAIIQYRPELNAIQNPTFAFNAELIKPYPYNDTQGFENFVPALETTPFVLEGTSVTLQDDGVGNVVAVTASTGKKSLFKRSIGTIDYTTGTVRLSRFIVESVTNGLIKFIVNTKLKDITPPKDRIISIREEDISVTIRRT